MSNTCLQSPGFMVCRSAQIPEFLAPGCKCSGCFCDHWKHSFLPWLIFNWRTFSRRVTAHCDVSEQVSTNQNLRNGWCHIVRGTVFVGHWTLDAGLWTLNAGLWTLDSEPWTGDTWSWMLESGLWTSDAGLGTRIWTLNATLWTLDSGHWTLSLTVSEQNQNPVSDSAWLSYW